MVIRVIALNDDNHDTCFVTKDTMYYNAKRFMEGCLLNPHGDQYIIRGVCICDPPNKLAEMDEDEFCNEFSLLEHKPQDLIANGGLNLLAKRNDIFEKFWENGRENWF